MDKQQVEFGDFQTPEFLVQELVRSLRRIGYRWDRVIEPTCGIGNFLSVLSEDSQTEIKAIEVQEEYAKQAASRSKSPITTTVYRENIFRFDLGGLSWRNTGEMLVIGNPPWVTNSALGRFGGENLPIKSNLRSLKGLDALTGDSNFDISEAIWFKTIVELQNEKPLIAMICKRSVARNVLDLCRRNELPIQNVRVFGIDSGKCFNVAVDACVLTLTVGRGLVSYEAACYKDLSSVDIEKRFGFSGNLAVADLDKYDRVRFLEGTSQRVWRQGIKHDLSAVMELTVSPEGLINGAGERVNVESAHLYPLLKCTDLFHGRSLTAPKKLVIVPQKSLGEDTEKLRSIAPRLWTYLSNHSESFKNRKSSIYATQPKFGIFGIGDYSFAPYKLAISGLHKEPRFRVVPPCDGKPVMLDDTCYFSDCANAVEVQMLEDVFNHSFVLEFLAAITNLDAKRPITKKALQRIDLLKLVNKLQKDQGHQYSRELLLGNKFRSVETQSELIF